MEKEILEELDNIYGTDKCKDVIKNYVSYIKMKKEGQIKFGNYNILIRNKSEYGSSEKLVEIIWKILKTNNIITTQYKYLERDEIRKSRLEKYKNKIISIEEELLVVDTKRLDISMFEVNREVRDILESFPEKIFIIVDEDVIEGLINANMGDKITWTMGIEKISKENKVDYINKFLKNNNLGLEPKNTFVDTLSDEPFWKVKNELVNILLECKSKKIEKITDEVVEKELKRNYYKKNSQSKDSRKKDGMKELESLIGMDSVKAQIEQIVNYIKVNKKREKMPALHMCFLGNPGTGKTTVARIVGKIFAEQEILSKKEKFVEIHGRDLIAKYVGWTAKTTQDKVREAEGGVLFIDEAYSLNPRDHRGFEDEAIATLIKEMEDKRDKVCVILAGYTNETEELLKTNPGFESRIQFKVEFPDYTEEELYEIFKKMAKEDNYKLSNNIKEILIDVFKNEKKKENFSNARCVRNIFEKVKFAQADRIARNKQKDINLIKKCDIENVISKLETKEPEKIRIGFAS